MKDLQELPKLRDSISYIYLEHAIIEQDDLSIVAICKDGRIPIPVAATTCLLLGPGTNITHAAIRTIGENGCMVIWCGEKATRFYASGMGETRSSKNLLLQAECCVDPDKHMQVVRRMYALRFPGIDTSGMTLQQVRGMEGIRVRKTYELFGKTTGVKWKKRTYKTESWEASDAINRALSEANAMLYGVCHAAIVSMGFSAGLGFIHTGKQLSFVYDIADLYKTETTIPAAFEAVAKGGDIHKELRSLCRKYFASSRLMERIPKDLTELFGGIEGGTNAASAGTLWSENGEIEGGKNYGSEV